MINLDSIEQKEGFTPLSNQKKEKYMSFQIPSDVKMRKEQVGQYWAYIFRHNKLGDLGRIVVIGQPNGETKFNCELMGGPDDPMHEHRKAIFEPLSREVMTYVETQLGKKGRSVKPEGEVKGTGHVIANRTILCDKCDQPTAFLIFANEWETEGDLENAARLMYPDIQRLNVPTWVIGEISGEGNPMENETIIKKVHPERVAMFRSSPSVFNAMLEGLDEGHC